MSLRTFHLAFIVIAIVAADMFGAWTIYYYPEMRDNLLLALGLATILGSFALIFYAMRLVQKFDRANIH